MSMQKPGGYSTGWRVNKIQNRRGDTLSSMTLKEQIEAYHPFNEQEERDKENLLKWMDLGEDLYTRDNAWAHWTASAWVTNRDHTKILMAYHNIYKSWSWLGGHADGDHDLLHVAIKEVMEESSLKNVKPLSDSIFSLEILTVDGHVKRGSYVSSHLHLNVTYLLEADDREPIANKPDENKAVSWFGLDEAVEASSEEWFRTHIYNKLNAKLRQFDCRKD
jgi:ADP-ribose pyrophosphatase YjhB (NUDIX family)